MLVVPQLRPLFIFYVLDERVDYIRAVDHPKKLFLLSRLHIRIMQVKK